MLDINEKKKRPCVVPACHGERFNLVHKFPMEHERTMKWLEALEIPELHQVPVEKLRTSYFICSRHFRSQDYKNAISRHLNKTATPSLNLKSLDQMDLIVERCLPAVEVNGTDTVAPTTNRLEENSCNIDANNDNKRKHIDLRITPTETELFKKNRLFDTETSSVSQCNILRNQPKVTNEYAIVIDKCNTVCSKEEQEHTEPISNENLEEEGIEERLILLHEEEFSGGQMENTGMAANFIEVSHPNFSEVLTLDNFWLRDHCRCSTCYNIVTNQRKYDLLDIPLDVKPLVTEVRNGMLYVKWDDEHESCFNFDFLYQALVGFVRRANENITCLWNGKLAPCLDYARVCLSMLVTSNDAVKAVVKSLVAYGFAFIENVPPNQDMTEMAIRRIFPIQKTFFGEMWTFTNRQDHSDTAYTKEYLAPHTDNSYFQDAAGLQIFHCIKHNGSGGETILVDGYNVISDLKVKNPEAYEKLCKVKVPAEYIEEGQHHTYSAPVIRVNDITNAPEQIRFNLYDRSILSTLPQTEMFEFYRDFRELIKLVQCEDNKWIFKLKPGTVLIFDNWRILHGREKYTGTREITGCYVSRTDYLSKARILDLIS